MQLMENASQKEVLMMSFEEKMKKELKKTGNPRCCRTENSGCI